MGGFSTLPCFLPTYFVYLKKEYNKLGNNTYSNIEELEKAIL